MNSNDVLQAIGRRESLLKRHVWPDATISNRTFMKDFSFGLLRELERFDETEIVNNRGLIDGVLTAAERQQLSRALRKLECDGLIERPDSYSCKLTDTGRQQLAQLQKVPA
jgi:hypothetical protein